MNVITADKPHQCTQCNRGFTRKYDLKRHELNVHNTEEDEYSELSSFDDNTESDYSEADHDDYASEYHENSTEYENSTSSSEEDTSDSEMSGDEFEDNLAYQDWYQEAIEETQMMRNEKIQKYINQGMDEEEAKEKAYMKTLWAMQHAFFNKYMEYLWSNMYLKDDETHQEIMDDLEDKVNNGMDIRKALKRVIAQHRSKFDGIFIYDKDSDEEMEADDEDHA